MQNFHCSLKSKKKKISQIIKENQQENGKSISSYEKSWFNNHRCIIDIIEMLEFHLSCATNTIKNHQIKLRIARGNQKMFGKLNNLQKAKGGIGKVSVVIEKIVCSNQRQFNFYKSLLFGARTYIHTNVG